VSFPCPSPDIVVNAALTRSFTGDEAEPGLNELAIEVRAASRVVAGGGNGQAELTGRGLYRSAPACRTGFSNFLFGLVVGKVSYPGILGRIPRALFTPAPCKPAATRAGTCVVSPCGLRLGCEGNGSQCRQNLAGSLDLNRIVAQPVGDRDGGLTLPACCSALLKPRNQTDPKCFRFMKVMRAPKSILERIIPSSNPIKFF
jgi:hypothetical protein